MSHTLILLWLGASGARFGLEADIEAWARTRRVELADPESGASSLPAVDHARVTRIERRLSQARAAAGALDDARASKLLAEVEAEIRAHPEMPQAAWLLAERLHIEASIAERDAEAANRAPSLRQRALVLEGARAPVFRAEGSEATASAAPTPKSVKPVFRGLARGERLYVDGVLWKAGAPLARGEHHLRVVREGAAVWADFLTIESGDVQLPVPGIEPCSDADLDGTRVEGRAVFARTGARCPRWAVARPAAAGGIEIATCRGDRCGELFVWRRGFGEVYTGPPQPEAQRRPVRWVAIALAGASVIAATSIVVWKTGAFGERDSGETRFVFQGPQAGTLSF